MIASRETRASPLDIWGNVKIPKIEYLETSAKPDGEGWYEAKVNGLTAYPSVVGIPMLGQQRESVNN